MANNFKGGITRIYLRNNDKFVVCYRKGADVEKAEAAVKNWIKFMPNAFLHSKDMMGSKDDEMFMELLGKARLIVVE